MYGDEHAIASRPRYLGRFRGLGDDGQLTDNNSDYVDPFASDSEDVTTLPEVDVLTAPPPTSVALSTTSIGTGPSSSPTVTSPLPSTAPVPQTTAAFRNPDGTPTYDGAPYSPTDLLNPYNLRHLFTGTYPAPVTPSGTPYAPTLASFGAASVPSSGLSPTTLILLAGAGIAAALLLSKKGASA